MLAVCFYLKNITLTKRRLLSSFFCEKPFNIFNLWHKGKKKRDMKAVIAATATVASLIMVFSAFTCWKRLAKHNGKARNKLCFCLAFQLHLLVIIYLSINRESKRR